MEKELALELIKVLVQKGEVSSAEIVCYDNGIDLSVIDNIQ